MTRCNVVWCTWNAPRRQQFHRQTHTENFSSRKISQRERGGDRDRDRETEKDRDRDREIERQKQRDRDRQTNRRTDRENFCGRKIFSLCVCVCV